MAFDAVGAFQRKESLLQAVISDIHANLEVEETSGYESPEAKIARLQKEERQRDSFYEMFVEGGRDDSEAA